MIIPSSCEQSYSRTPQEVVYSQNKWCNFVFGSTFALYGLMADSLDSLSKYRGLIQTFYDEFESDKRE